MYGPKQITCEHRLCICCSVMFLCCFNGATYVTCDDWLFGQGYTCTNWCNWCSPIYFLDKFVFNRMKEQYKVLLPSLNSKYWQTSNQKIKQCKCLFDTSFASKYPLGGHAIRTSLTKPPPPRRRPVCEPARKTELFWQKYEDSTQATS